MSQGKSLVLIVVCLLSIALLASAAQYKFGIADTRRLTFSEPVRVGDVMLPKGDYEVTHSMQGMDHIMVFRQLNARQPAEVRVKCQLVPLPRKAEQTQQEFVINAANERVLHTLIFQGDTAQHVF